MGTLLCAALYFQRRAGEGFVVPPEPASPPAAAQAQAVAPASSQSQAVHTVPIAATAAMPSPASGETPPSQRDHQAETVSSISKTAPFPEYTPPEAGGGPAIATVRVRGKALTLEPNASNRFPRVYVEPQDTVAVTVRYPQGQPGQPVSIQVMDGGQLENQSIVHIAQLDANESLAFQFQLSDQPGIHRVVLSKDGVNKLFDFWAGPELPFAKR